MHSELVPSSLSCLLMCVRARAININSFLGLEICMQITVQVENGRRACFSTSPEEEVLERENKELDFIEL